MPRKFQFPVWLKGTPEEQAADAAAQELARASFGRGHLSEAERLVGRGALLEETARGNLKAEGRHKHERELAESQLADALAMQGKYAEAADTHPDPVKTKYFQDVIAALEMPDETKCHCKDSTATIDGQDIAITPRFEREEIFSPVHGELVSLVECRKCHHMNARPLRSRLLKHNAATAQNEAVARSGNPRLISDAQLLRVDGTA